MKRLLAWSDRLACIAPLVLAATASCSSTPKGRPIGELAERINATLSPEAVVLGAGDQLEVRFPRFPEWNHSTTVRPDGSASFLSVDDVRVAGLTVPQLDQRLTEAYAKVLTEPDLTILVAQLAAQATRNFVVIGEVKRPGLVQMTDTRVTLVDALGEAGGPDRRTAKLSHLLLVRWMPDLQRQTSWKIDARPDYWNSPLPIYIQPYDIIYVPSTPISKANEWIDQYIRRMIPLPGFFSPNVVQQL